MKFLIFTLLFVKTIFASEFCPIPESAIESHIDVQVIKKDNIYIYNYTFSNSSSSPLPLILMNIDSKTKPISVESPSGWNVREIKKMPGAYLIQWNDYSGKKLPPGKSISGFVIRSANPPGNVRARIKGSNYNPVKLSDYPTRGKQTICPGIWASGSSAEKDHFATLMTTGPVSENLISIEMQIDKVGDQKWISKQELSPLETGLIDIIISAKNGLEVDQIDISSLKLGRGEAKVVNSQKNEKWLRISFDLKDINVLCDIDHALFLKGKLKNGKDLFGGVKIKPSTCSAKNWIKEIPKIKASDTTVWK